VRRIWERERVESGEGFAIAVVDGLVEEMDVVDDEDGGYGMEISLELVEWRSRLREW
jgi:hypothetical protein